MKRFTKIFLMVIGILLVLNGLVNIFDDAMILSYDITSILSGFGFGLVAILVNSKN